MNLHIVLLRCAGRAAAFELVLLQERFQFTDKFGLFGETVVTLSESLEPTCVDGRFSVLIENPEVRPYPDVGATGL